MWSGLVRRAGQRLVPWGAGVVLLLMGAVGLSAQQGAIAGTVVDAQSLEAVQGAQVFIPGTDLGTLTDDNGRYRLTGVPAGQVEVQVRLIGYRQVSRMVTVTAGQTATADFQLPVSAVQLQGVVVNVITGLERQNRQLGVNVSEIDASRVNNAQITNVDQFLVGRASGIVVQQTSGDVGSASRIRIRGSNSISLSNEPLIFVDGIQVTNSFFVSSTTTNLADQAPSRLNDLSPDDIQSIEVVKGPAASALYGSVGANGVILITTKRGQAGTTSWNVYAEGSIQTDHSRWPANFVAAQVIGNASAPLFTENGFNSTDFKQCTNLDAAETGCTQDVTSVFNSLKDKRTEPFNVGDIQTYGGSVAGGSDIVTYFISGEAEFNDGVINFNQAEKVNVRTNIDAGILDNLNASLSVGYVDRDTRKLSDSNSIFSPLIAGLCGKAGFIPGTADNGGPNRANYCFFRNLKDQQEASLSREQDRRFTGSGNVTWRPLSWLSAQGNFGLDLLDQSSNFTVQPGLDNLTSTWFLGRRNSASGTRQNWTANGSFAGTLDLTSSITSTTTAGGSFQEEQNRDVGCFGAGLVAGTRSCSSTTQLFSVSEAFLNIVTLGAFFQQEFAIGDRLFVTGAVRLDDNSNSGGNVGLQAYPSASVSYVISDEGWFPTGSLLNSLQLRAAFGQAGTRPGFRDAVTRFSPITVAIGGSDTPGVTLAETGNELLKPERVTEFEGGLNLGLLNDRLGIEFTYFDKTAREALIRRRLAPSFGLTASFLDNLGKIHNTGSEFTVRAAAVDKSNFKANFLGQFTTLKNRVKELGEGVEPIIFGFGSAQRHDVGLPAGAFFTRRFSFNDANGDGKIARSEVTVAQDPEFLNESSPTWTASLTSDLEFFKFVRFSALVDARGGHSQSDFTELFRCRQGLVQRGVGCKATGDPNASQFQQARLIAARFFGEESGFIRQAAFLKWREMSVSFSAPPSLARKNKLLERTTLTFSGRNLGLLTKYDGIDPELQSSGANANFSQAEFNTQPPLRTFTLRLDVRF